MKPARFNPSSAIEMNDDVFAAMLDEVDYPMLLVSEHLSLLHLNAAAVAQFGDLGALTVDKLGLDSTRDQFAMVRAVKAACGQGKRSFIQIRHRSKGLLSASVVPLDRGDEASTALLIMAKPRFCQELSLHGFARESRLTDVETRVLRLLCAGLSVQDIADAHNVKVSTIRTQMTSLRSKTGAKDIRDVLFKLAVLPPVLGALRSPLPWSGTGTEASQPQQ